MGRQIKRAIAYALTATIFSTVAYLSNNDYVFGIVSALSFSVAMSTSVVRETEHRLHEIRQEYRESMYKLYHSYYSGNRRKKKAE